MQRERGGYLRQGDLDSVAHLPVYGAGDALIGHVERDGWFVDPATYTPIEGDWYLRGKKDLCLDKVECDPG